MYTHTRTYTYICIYIYIGMIKELRELWETELVRMLKEELSQELSTEQRIVNASLKCVDPSQRAGVEALFVCFGCFEEDVQVPAQALDVLAPIGVSARICVFVCAFVCVRVRACQLICNIMYKTTSGFVHALTLHTSSY